MFELSKDGLSLLLNDITEIMRDNLKKHNWWSYSIAKLGEQCYLHLGPRVEDNNDRTALLDFILRAWDYIY